MIVILTLNPSLDYYMKFDAINLGQTNHSISESVKIGGKGINSAILLNNLGIQSHVYGFIGGFTGNYLLDSLKKYKYITPDFISTNSMTRINVKVSECADTELNGSGSQLDHEAITELEHAINKLSAGDVVLISGRLANGMDQDWYIKLVKMLSDKGIAFTLDITGSKLLKMCQYGPLLLKPNLSELEAIFGTQIKTEEDIYRYGMKLIDMGAKYCIVSLGSKGSLFFSKEGIYQASVPEGIAINAVGAGDSMVAGFISKYQETSDPLQAYAMAVACGSATAFSESIGNKELIETLLSQIKLQKREI